MKKIFNINILLFSLLFLIVNNNINPQSKIDSVNAIINSLSGMDRILKANEIASALPNEDSLLKLEIFNESKKYAQSENIVKGIIITLNGTGEALFQLKKYSQAQQIFFEALRVSERSKENDSLTALIYSNIALNYEKIPNADSAIIFHRKSLAINIKLKNIVGEAFAYNNLGLIYWRRGENILAIENFKLAVRLREKVNNPRSLGNAVQNLGVAYWKYGDYYNAFKCYQQALKLREEVGNRTSYAMILNNIGLIYKRLRYNNLAEENFTEALRIADSAGYKAGIGYSNSNFGELYLEQGNPKKALEHFWISYNITSEARDLNGISLLLNSIGRSYEALKDLETARKYYRNAIDTSKSINDKYALAMSMTNLARVLVNQNKIDEAEDLINESKLISQSNNLLEILRDNYQLLSQIHVKNKRFAEAYSELQNYTLLKDSLFNSVVIHNISNFNVRLTIEKTLQENELLKQKNEFQLADIERQKVLNNVLFIIIILTLGIFVILYIYFRNQRRYTKLIQKQKNELENLNELLKQSNLNLEEINQTKDKLFTIIAHDLKSPFMSLMGFSKILNEEIESGNVTDAKLYASYIHSSSSQLVVLIQNLLDWARIQKNMISANPEKIELQSLIETLLKSYRIIAESKGIMLRFDCPPSMFIKADRGMIESSLRNLISNAIKFTNAEGEISIKVNQGNQTVEINVSDNGVGMTKEQLSKLFSDRESSSTRGTDNEQGTGLGLIIARDFVEKNNGKLEVQSEDGKGTTFTIIIPAVE
ncbi:MAG: tetratricopeptide repeat-containing sensor histidine kinase [Ignavibacteriaceae bacterium]|nr:tetratricopeptide repeat-containing sensor histidine kinase [Ignavibacteriaceae bacterium]